MFILLTTLIIINVGVLNMDSRKRKPAHPGRILKNMYIKPLGITVTKLAETLGVSRKAVSSIINEHKSVTSDMALRLSMAFDTTPELWSNLQNTHDLFCARHDSIEWKTVPRIPMDQVMV